MSRVLVFNAGSTSLKVIIDQEELPVPCFVAEVEWPHGKRSCASILVKGGQQSVFAGTIDASCEKELVRRIVTFCPDHPKPELVAHRIVHGGPKAPEAALVDGGVLNLIRAYLPLAPQHNRAALEIIEATLELFPGIPQVAVFDTAFFASMPEWARIYGLPYEWSQRGWVRVGFHGISHAWCLKRVAELRRQSPSEFRLITAHLGGGCSVAAVDHGQPVGCTMGFTALDGLPMATRSGSVDPGLLIYLLEQKEVSIDELRDVLYDRSGILGISGVSADLRQVYAAAERGDLRAKLAFDYFVDQLAMAIGGLATRMNGLDALCFTDRLGVSMPELRLAVCRRLSHLGIMLDLTANAQAKPDAVISGQKSQIDVYVVQTQEERYIAFAARRLFLQKDTKG